MLRTLQTALHFAAKPSSAAVVSRTATRSLKMNSSTRPLQGLYQAPNVKAVYYGPSIVSEKLLSALPSETSKAFIVTGSSLATKTPLISDLEKLLAHRHAGTFSRIGQHAPVAQLDEATELVKSDDTIDTIISVGGGSPIDSAKAIIYRVHEKSEKWLRHIAVPTTLSAAECTAFAGYTRSDGLKTSVGHPLVGPAYIFYDPVFGRHTPPNLFLSTAFRALDHAVEAQYHPSATWVPCRTSGFIAINQLFELLPKYKADPKDEDVITALFLAAYSSLGFLGLNVTAGLGLSHTLGYALGSPYQIPHGVTSCLTLGHVVKLKATLSKQDAESLALILPYIGKTRSGDDVKDAQLLGDAILQLVEDMGQKTNLTDKGVSKDEVDTICARATGGLHPNNIKEKSKEEQELLVQLRDLVEKLW